MDYVAETAFAARKLFQGIFHETTKLETLVAQLKGANEQVDHLRTMPVTEQVFVLGISLGIFGWDTLKMAEHYTRNADQQRLTKSAMHMLDTQEQTRTESCPTEASSGTISAKT